MLSESDSPVITGKVTAVPYCSVTMEIGNEMDSVHSSSSSSSQLDQESHRHIREMKHISLDFQRVAISGEDHSGVREDSSEVFIPS